MKLNRERSLCSHQQHTEDFADPRKSARVNLHDINGLCLQQLLEYHAIVRVFSCGHTDPMRLKSLPYRSMSQDVVGGRGLLDEPLHMKT